MQPLSDPTLQELCDYLIKLDNVCDSIEQRAQRLKDSPLVRVARMRLSKLVAEVHSVTDSIVEAAFTDESGDEGLEYCINRARSLNPGILAALDVLEFCRTHDQVGHDGELNALYARLNLGLDDGGSGGDGRLATWKERARLARLEDKSKGLVRLVDSLGPLVDSPDWALRQCAHHPPELEAQW